MNIEKNHNTIYGTTIICIKKDGKVAMGGDGQVTLGNVVMKGSAKKVRKLYQDKILAGFAGGTADAFTLLDLFEAKLEKYQGHLMRSAVDLAKEWRTDRVLRKLEAMLIVADINNILIITGNGDVLDPEHGVAAIGSGGNYAYSAGIALHQHSNLNASGIVKEALKIAGDLCIYTNHHLTLETLD